MQGGGRVCCRPLTAAQQSHSAARPRRVTTTPYDVVVFVVHDRQWGKTRASTQPPSAPRPKAVNRNDTNAAHMLRP